MRGAPAYLCAAVKEIFRFRAFPVEIHAEGVDERMDCLSLGLANGKYCGGGFMLAPNADATDGRIDIAAIGDFPKLDDTDWHCFTLSRYDRNTGEWEMEKAPVYHIVD